MAESSTSSSSSAAVTEKTSEAGAKPAEATVAGQSMVEQANALTAELSAQAKVPLTTADLDPDNTGHVTITPDEAMEQASAKATENYEASKAEYDEAQAEAEKAAEAEAKAEATPAPATTKTTTTTKT